MIPSHSYADVVQAQQALSNGEYEQALKLAARLHESSPDSHELVYLRGVAELMCEHLDAAIEHLRQALDAEPGRSLYANNLGEALRRNQQPEAAIEVFERALALSPEYALARYNLGCACMDAGHADDAVKQFSALVVNAPNNADYVIALADAVRETGQFRTALELYQKGIEIDPGHVRGHANLGALLMQLGQAEQGLESCQQAVTIDPAHALGHHNMGRCLVELGRLDEAMEAYAQAFELAPDSDQLAVNIGQVWLETGDLSEALSWFTRAREMNADSVSARLGITQVLREMGNIDAATEQLQQLLDNDKQDFNVLLEAAQVSWDDGASEEALEFLEKAAKLRPEAPLVHTQRGAILASMGRVNEAVQAQHQALAISPNFIPALSGLATTLRAKLDDQYVDKMQQLLKQDKLRDSARASLHNGLAFYFDGAGRYNLAIEHSKLANQHQWAFKSERGWEYDVEQQAQHIERLQTVFTEALFQQKKGLGHADDSLVFVVGMPRSGTTLTEQILGSHPQALGIGEKDFATRSLQALPLIMNQQADPLSLMEKVSARELLSIAEQYLGWVEQLKKKAGKLDAIRVIDKMPDNYMLLGWIALLFPNARIIHARRDVRDIALSCWMTQFKSIVWACDMEHIACRIRDYQIIMDHWRKVLPSGFFESDYEQLVANPEPHSRALVEFIGLDWHPACLNFHQSDSLVRTASVTQVRRPIYRKSVQRWKPYSELLEPVLKYACQHKDQ